MNQSNRSDLVNENGGGQGGLGCDYARSAFLHTLNFFKAQGWPCEKWGGYDAFALQARVPTGFRDKVDVFNITVSASGPLLLFETVLMPLPKPPWLAVRETLNELNLLSNGAVFLLRDCGIVLSYRLLLRKSEDQVPGQRLLQVLERLNQERVLVLPVLNEVASTGLANLPRLRRMFSSGGMGSGALLVLPDMQMLCNMAGWYSFQDGEMIWLSKESLPIKQYPVRLSIRDGSIRAYVVPGRHPENRRWESIKGLVKYLRHDGIDTRCSWDQYGRVLKVLGDVTESTNLVRYVWQEGRILALTSYVPFESRLCHEEFRAYLNALFRCVENGITHTSIFRRAG